LAPGHIVLDGDPAPPKRGTAPNFWPMSIVAKELPISDIAEHLLPNKNRKHYERKLEPPKVTTSLLGSTSHHPSPILGQKVLKNPF